MKIVRLNEIPDEIRGDGSYSIKRIFTEPLRKNPKNVGFYETTIPAHSKVKNHYHEKLDEILYFLTPGKIKINSETHLFNPGDFIVLPSGTPHEIIAEDKKVKLIAMKFPNIIEDKISV